MRVLLKSFYFPCMIRIDKNQNAQPNSSDGDGTHEVHRDPRVIHSSIKRIADIPSLSELPEERIEFLVDGYIAKSSVTLVCGEAGAGKSTWALALACAVSKGEPFAGFKTQRAPVLYLDRENPLPVAQQRLREQNTRTGDAFHYWGSWLAQEPARLSDLFVSARKAQSRCWIALT